MKKNKIIVLAALIIFIFQIIETHAQEKASPQEVIQKAKEASEFLSKTGDEGLKEFMDRKGRWVWKDTYVFVMNCKIGTIAAHSIKPKLIGKQLMGLKDITGKLFFAEFCSASENEKGGWVEYMWQKIGEKMPARKISYLLQVPETDYQVGVGIYDEKLSVEELNKLK